MPERAATMRRARLTRSLRIAIAVVATSVACALAAIPASADSTEAPATLLVIYQSYKGFAPYERVSEQLLAALRANARQPVEVQAEFLDVMVSRGDEYNRAVVDYIRQKYAGNRIVAVMGVGASGARISTRIREDVFPDVPLLYTSVDRIVAQSIDFGGNSTGITGSVDVGGTASLAVALVPGTRNIAAVVGSSDVEKVFWTRVPAEIHAVAPDINVIPLFGLARDELLRRLESLPEHTVVLWGAYYREPNGGTYAPNELIAEASRRTNSPMFCLFEYDLGLGGVGGRVVDLGRQGEEAGKLAARIVNGESASAIPRLDILDNPVEVDWREVRRWNIDPGRIPPGAVVAYRNPTAWDRYKWYVLGGAAVIVVQAILIVGLAVQRRHRVRVQQELEERGGVERLVADLSARFSDLPAAEIDAALAFGLIAIRELFRADRASLVLAEADGRLEVAFSASAPGVEPLSDRLSPDAFPEIAECVETLQIVHYSANDAPTPELSALRTTLGRRSIRTLVAVPLHAGGIALGAFSIVSMNEEIPWNPDYQPRLSMLADVFANAIVRKRGDAELKRSAALSDAVLRSMGSQVCVLDREGRIVAVNDAWRQAADEPGSHVSCLLTGTRCAFESAADAPCALPESAQAQRAIRDVLEGRQASFSTEYRVKTATLDNWFLLTVEPLRIPEGGVVISHQNVTARKRSELEAEQRRQELAHVARVSTMGELAASIAHELNQPLTGVLTNAQAAVRYLAHDPPNVEEVREILRDIIEDDRRAGEVIRRLRAMLQTGEIEPAEINMRDVVAEVLRLLGSDAVLRSVHIESDCTDGVPLVRGDRIQLQQVVLNLVVNAMDAMKDVGPQHRNVRIALDASESDMVVISVSDAGHGIAPDKLGRIFQPFFTTKPDGMGMGLSIARTIVEAHGGMLWAENNGSGGATFYCRLPAAEASDGANK